MDAFTVNVRSNASTMVQELLSAKWDMPQATARALNRMAEQALVKSARQVRDAGYNLKISEIKKALRVARANQGQLKSAVIATGKPIPLIAYGARQVANGVSVNVLNGRKVIAEAFIATMPSGHKGVFVRKPGAKHKKVGVGANASWHALPIRQLYGPSIPDGMANDKVREAIMALIEEKFPQLLDHELKWAQRRGM